MSDERPSGSAVESADDRVDVTRDRRRLTQAAAGECDAAAGAALVAAYRDLAEAGVPDAVLGPVREAAFVVAAGTDTRVDEGSPVGFGVDRERAVEVRASSILVATAEEPRAVTDAAFAWPLRDADGAASYRGVDRLRRPVDPGTDLDAVRETLGDAAARESPAYRAAGAVTGLDVVRESDAVAPGVRAVTERAVGALVDRELDDVEGRAADGVRVGADRVRTFVARATALPGASERSVDAPWPRVDPADEAYDGAFGREVAAALGLDLDGALTAGLEAELDDGRGRGAGRFRDDGATRDGPF